MKTSLALIAAAALAPCACESTTPAQRYAQSQQLVAQAYGNKLSPAQQAALATMKSFDRRRDARLQSRSSARGNHSLRRSPN